VNALNDDASFAFLARRKSLFVDERHCSLSNAIALQVGNKLVVRHDRLFAALSNRG
jgi:hypothetical protein